MAYLSIIVGLLQNKGDTYFYCSYFTFTLSAMETDLVLAQDTSRFINRFFIYFKEI